MNLYTVKYKHRLGWLRTFTNVKANSEDAAIDYCEIKLYNSKYYKDYRLHNVEVQK